MTDRRITEPNYGRPADNLSERPADLTGDTLAEVAARLTTESPAQTAADLTNFKMAGSIARNAVENSPVGLFHRRLTRLGVSAKLLFDNTIPQADEVVQPSRLKSAAPIIDYQLSHRKHGLVDQVLTLPDEERQAEAMALLKDKLQAFNAEDKTRLIDRALHLFSTAGHSDDQIGGAQLLIHGYDYLSNSHKGQILDLLRGEGNAEDIYFNVQEDYRSRQRQPSSVHSNTSAQQAIDHDSELVKIETAVRNLTADGLVPDERLSDVERASNALAERYRILRNEVIDSTRVRDNSGRGR
ncbi:hypothetical protein G6M86_28260 (plasmid) [Agrobacterium tumefaciens]|uniref:Uncharacterized protein n=1 Tax=Agrobacterium tumefaciens TaxID=358 RepID=A0AAJ4N9J7_AGRTU|nr:hypothetical protein G6M86_28260 [Agrobacterium tumefaciens]